LLIARQHADFIKGDAKTISLRVIKTMQSSALVAVTFNTAQNSGNHCIARHPNKLRIAQLCACRDIFREQLLYSPKE